MRKTKSKLSEYEFVKDVPKNIVKIPTFLSGDFGRDFLEEYQGRAKSDYKNADVLNVLRERDDIIEGSNPYVIVLANQILRQEGLRTATPADVERILKSEDLALSGCYIDTGLVLRSEDEPNKYLARDLKKQLGKKKLPVMTPLAGLDLRVDEDSPSRLAFVLGENAEVIYDAILNSNDGRFNSKDINEKIGLPKKLEGEDRCFYTGNLGLSRFCLGGWDSDLGSGGRGLDGSYDCGRVIVVARKNKQ